MSLFIFNGISRVISFAVVLSAFCPPTSVIAQEHAKDRGATVSVSATHEIVLVPEKIRLQMLVRAESREGENAMKLLRKHQERLKKDLVGLNAVESSIEFSETSMSVGTPGVDDPEIARRMIRQQAAQLAQMRNLNPQLRGQIQTPTSEDGINDLPQIFAATSVLMAEWKVENGLEILAKVAGRKLGGMRSISSNPIALPQNYPQSYALNVSNSIVAFARKNVREVASEDPNGLRQMVAVNVSFDVE